MKGKRGRPSVKRVLDNLDGNENQVISIDKVIDTNGNSKITKTRKPRKSAATKK